MLHDRFVDAIHARDAEAVQAALAPDIRFLSPVVFKAYEGRDLVGTILTEGAMKVFEDFEYVHRLEDPEARVATLIFRARVGGREPSTGSTCSRFDDDGLIAELKVMVRPLSGMNALAAAMGERFEALGLDAARARPVPTRPLVSADPPRKASKDAWRSARLESSAAA